MIKENKVFNLKNEEYKIMLFKLKFLIITPKKKLPLISSETLIIQQTSN